MRKIQKKKLDYPTFIPQYDFVGIANINAKKSKSPKPLTQRNAAKILDVSAEHLNRVVRGKLPNPKLLADYNFLLARAKELKTLVTS